MITKSQFQPPEWLKDLRRNDLPELTDREAVSLVLADLDYDAQLLAIRHVLHRNREVDQSLRDEIKKIEEFARNTSGLRNEHAVDEWMDRIHNSIYQDAAHSMAAVGMLAPLLESIFSESFNGIRRFLELRIHPSSVHSRWQQPAEDQWDCHFVWDKGRRSKNVVGGIMQLSEAVGLTAHLPRDLRPTLQALFEYRNKMFHFGFEWPLDERERFQKRIEGAGWPSDWFTKATADDKPWIFYFTDSFINHCLVTVEGVLDGFGAFARHELLPQQASS